jgi:hypothetical protein
MPLIINALQFSKNYLVSPFYPTYTGTTNGKFVIEIFKKEYRSNDYVYIIKPGILEFKYYFDCSQINCVYGGDNKLEDELELFLKNKGRKWIYLVQLPRDRMKEVIGFITKFASIDYFITDPPQYVMLILCR